MMWFYNGCCLLAMIEVVTLTDALVTNRKYSSCVMSHFVFIGFLFKLLTDCIASTNILCNVDDDSSKTYDDLNNK